MVTHGRQTVPTADRLGPCNQSHITRQGTTGTGERRNEESGAGGGNRTPDLSLTKRLLYQLSYTGIGGRAV